MLFISLSVNGIFINKQPRNRFGSWVSFYLYDIILEQASFKDGGRFLTGGGSYGLHHYERIIGTWALTKPLCWCWPLRHLLLHCQPLFSHFVHNKRPSSYNFGELQDDLLLIWCNMATVFLTGLLFVHLYYSMKEGNWVVSEYSVMCSWVFHVITSH